MVKVLFIVILLGAAADELASSHREPPLLIDSPGSSLAPVASSPLDAVD